MRVNTDLPGRDRHAPPDPVEITGRTYPSLRLDGPNATRSSRFEQFYAEWYPRAVRAAQMRGLQDAEAVASDIMITFMTANYLDKYDPTREGATTFESWVNHIMYLRLNNAHRAETRQPQTVTMNLTFEGRVEHDGHAQGGRSRGTLQDRSALDFSDLCRKVYQLITQRYGDDLGSTWVAVVKQVTEDTTARSGILRQWLMAKHLQIAQKTVGGKMDSLRSVILEDDDLREMLNADRALTTV